MTYSEAVTATREFLFKRQSAYRAVFTGPVGETVLADLAKFCRANESIFDKDPHVVARLEGRRDVWLRLQTHLNLSQEQLWKLQSGE